MSEALHDSLTGLITPFFFYESATRLRFWADRKGQPLSLISIKGIGLSDEDFARVARSMIDELRGGDLLCRMGNRTMALMLVGDKSAAGHLIFRLENLIKPRLSYEAVELAPEEKLVGALERLGI